jgi:methylenetetrahydrofolate dehydrogenase (NADP+)/methenyltetrahydrofolate cyclohydrolase
MTCKILGGSDLATSILKQVTSETENFMKVHRRRPLLGVVLANKNPSSTTYVRKKVRACNLVGIGCKVYDHKILGTWDGDDLHPKESFAAKYDAKSYARYKLNQLTRMDNWSPGHLFHDAMIVQLPVEDCPDPRFLYECIGVNKDVDCFHPENVGRLVQGNPRFTPCTPTGIIALLKHYGHDLHGKFVTIINDSDIVGKPLSRMLEQEGCTVAVCHRRTDPKLLREVSRMSDILISAVGIPGFIDKEFVRSGQVVIDVGITRVEGEVVGDCSPEIREIVAAVSPVPFGVGPCTVAMLLTNVLLAAKLQA